MTWIFFWMQKCFIEIILVWEIIMIDKFWFNKKSSSELEDLSMQKKMRINTGWYVQIAWFYMMEFVFFLSKWCFCCLRNEFVMFLLLCIQKKIELKMRWQINKPSNIFFLPFYFIYVHSIRFKSFLPSSLDSSISLTLSLSLSIYNIYIYTIYIYIYIYKFLSAKFAGDFIIFWYKTWIGII